MSDENLTDLFKGGGSAALEQLLLGETAKLAQQHASNLLAKYGKIRQELSDLSSAIKNNVGPLSTLSFDAQSKFDPGWDRFDISKSDLDDVELFKFIGQLGQVLLSYITSSTTRLHAMSVYSNEVLPIFSNESLNYGELVGADEAADRLLATAYDEFESSVIGFDRVVAGVYLTTRKEYKKLRRKYLGEQSKRGDDRDELEDNMMMQLFGVRPQPKDVPLGPATALVDDNCILTQMLSDLVDALPKYYEKVVPVVNKGVVTGATKLVKHLDDGEVEDCSRLLTKSSHPTYVRYAQSPEVLLNAVMEVLTQFYANYAGIAKQLRALMVKANIGLDRTKKELQHRLLDPRSVARQYARINFLAIRPAAEDVAPRTRMERDFAAARNKLFAHMKETILALSGMDREDLDTEAYALKRTREAIELKSAMDEMTKSEKQKILSRNIRDDNEFYVSKGGNLGTLEVEREAAPKIRYEDVIGASFTRAKAHIEEVVKIASHPQIMRATAPRGDVKSNLLLIGPYGCGKTEMAKAIGADKRIIGFSLSTADLLTAYMHESVKNVKRMYDHSKDMRRQSRYTKPVGILLDEFDRFFNYGEGTHQAYDGPRMEGILQEMMDGVVGYEGVFLVALTNVPKAVPEAILRRFKYVDVVGQLTREERATLFKQFLTKGLPISTDVADDTFRKWAEMLDHAPGDVIGKVADEIHFKFMREFVDERPKRAMALERILTKKLRDREISNADRALVRKTLAAHKMVVEADVTQALEDTLKQPQVKMQINKAKEVYRDADEIMQGLSIIGDRGLGFGATVGRRSKLWNS